MVDLICELVLCLGFAIVLVGVPGFLTSLLFGKGGKEQPTVVPATAEEPVNADAH